MSLARQLKQHRERLRAFEAATAAEMARILAERPVDVSIVDGALLAALSDEALSRLQLQVERTVVIATGGAATPAAAQRQPFLVIDGVLEGVLNMGAIARALPRALDDLATLPVRRRAPCALAPTPRAAISSKPAEVILMAASTGGPTALAALLKRIGRPQLPIVIAQHMPADQTAGLARHLATESGHEMVELAGGDVAPAPIVTLLRGGSDYRISRSHSGSLRLIRTSHERNLFHPSADLLFATAAEAGIEAVAVVLSGMGEDGARGAAALAARGGRVLIQEFASCVVSGMPSATLAACPSAAVMSLAEIAERLTRWREIKRLRLAGRAEE